MSKQTRKPSYKQRKARAAFKREWGDKLTGYKNAPGQMGSWQRHARTDTKKRHTFYVTLDIISDGQGSPPFAEEGEVVPMTIAIFKKRRGKQLTGLTYDELARDFDKLLAQSMSRYGATPARDLKSSVTAIFRHKSK